MEIDKNRIVLKALLTGIPVKLGMCTYRVFKDGDEVKFPSMTGQVPEGEYFVAVQAIEPKDVYLGSEITLAGFLNLVGRVPDEDIIVLASNVALTEINRHEDSTR